jgi:hypothetical protein
MSEDDHARLRRINFIFLILVASVVLFLFTASTRSTIFQPNKQDVIVTFRVAGSEQYKIRLTDPTDIEIARRLLAGDDVPRIPNGLVVRGDADVNTGYSWHIDPNAVEFADVTTEVCDGLPSDVEKRLITSDHYCPWFAEVIAIDE